MRPWFKQRVANRSVTSNGVATIVIATLIVLLVFSITLQVVSTDKEEPLVASSSDGLPNSAAGTTCKASRCPGVTVGNSDQQRAESTSIPTALPNGPTVKTGAETFVTQSFSLVAGKKV